MVIVLVLLHNPLFNWANVFSSTANLLDCHVLWKSHVPFSKKPKPDNEKSAIKFSTLFNTKDVDCMQF